jgi:hypothetical protein
LWLRAPGFSSGGQLRHSQPLASLRFSVLYRGVAGGMFGEIHAKKIKIAVMMIVTIQNARSYFPGVRRRIFALSQNKNQNSIQTF